MHRVTPAHAGPAFTADRSRPLIALLLAIGLLMSLLPAGEADAAPGSWQRLADAPRKRQEASYVNLDGKLHLLGWTKAHKVYNPASNSWSTKAAMPVKRNHVQAVAVDGKIYMIGGLTSWPDGDVNTVYIYNPSTNKWTQGASMGNRGRGAGAVAVRGGKIYYAGGLHGGTAVSWFDVYDPATDDWTALPNMPRAREHFHGAVAGGRFWAIGGRQGPINSTVAQTDAFNFSTGKWETGYAPIPTKRGGFGIGVSSGEVIVFGGEGGGVQSAVQAYDTATDSWRSLTAMAKPRHGFQVAECGGAFYIATGSIKQGGGGASPYHDVFRLSAGTGC